MVQARQYLAQQTHPRRVPPSVGKGVPTRLATACLVVPLLIGPLSQAPAQSTAPATLAIVKQAVEAELIADRTDNTPWRYRDHDIQPGKDVRSAVIETPRGDLRRMLQLNGSPLTGAAAQRELNRIRALVHSPEEQAREKKAAEADGKQAREFLSMLPNAFLWRLVADTPETATLAFEPNPGFAPPDSQSRVLAVLSGQMVVARGANRIQSLRGTMIDDVKFGFGLFGKIDKGGTFNVERRELVPGKWQIVESHVHIGGHALLFKTIGQQEDEVKTDWHPSTAADLEAALRQLEQVQQ